MESKERVLTALDNRKPDRIPIFATYINEASIVNLTKILRPEAVKLQTVEERYGEEKKEVLDLYCFVIEELGLDATSTIFSKGMKYIDENRCRDKFGTVYLLSQHGEPVPVGGPIENRSDTKGFDMVGKLSIDDFVNVKYVIGKIGKSKAHFVLVTDPFKINWSLRGGMEHLLMDFMLDPELVHSLSRISTDFDLAAIDMAKEIGADAIFLVGDLASETTTIMSPEQYRKYIKPYHREIVDYTHKKGMKIVKHSDGNIWSILDDFLDVGFDGIHPIQPQCMDIGEVKEYIAKKMCILGNIDCRQLLPYDTRKEVEESVKEAITKAGSGGGYIVTSSNSIHPGCKPNNYITMVRTVHKYGRYD